MTSEQPLGFSTLSDLEAAASKKVTGQAWAYTQHGAGSEWTMKANREAFERTTLRPRVLVDAETLDLATSILNEKVSAPFYVSSTAYHGLLHPDAELARVHALTRGLVARSNCFRMFRNKSL